MLWSKSKGGHAAPEQPPEFLGPATVVLRLDGVATIRGAPAGSWLDQMLARKPKMLVIVAPANKNARIVWALLAKGDVYRAPGVPA